MKRSTIIATIFLLSFNAHARASERLVTVLPGDLAPALESLGKQFGVDVIYPSEQIRGLKTLGVTGTLETHDAFRKLIEGTPLILKEEGGAVLITLPKMPATSAPGSPLPVRGDGQGVRGSRDEVEPKGFWSRFRIAQADDASPVEERKTQGEGKEEGPGGSDKNSPDPNIDEVVVTGTHIRGSQAAGSRVVTVDRQTIDQSGYGELRSFVETLSQNFGGISEDFAGGVTIGNSLSGTEIQLRGLGPGTTLTLINGQRSPGGGAQGGFTDISNIPVAAIERVEILPDGASAIYGSDAIGGVVNVILRKNLEGGETRLRFGTSDGDANEMVAAQVYGHSWSSGHFLVGYQYTDRQSLDRGDRERLLGDQRARGGLDHRRDSSVQRGGAPGNILNSAGQVAYAIPSGQNGTSLTAAQLLPGGSNYQDISYASILPAQTMHSGFFSLSQQLGERVELLVDGRYSKRDGRHLSPLNGVVATVPSSNPFYVNPFGGTAPVRVEYDFTPELGAQTITGSNETFSIGVAPTIQLGGQWRLSVSGSYGEDRTDDRVVNRVNAAAVTAGAVVWNDTNPATALNVFGNGTANNPATLATLRLPDQVEHAKNSASSVGAYADGPLFALPGGSAKLALGVAYLSDQWDDTANGRNNVNGSISDSRRDMAEFAELSVPLVGPAQGIPAVRGLDISLAGRHDDYSDAGSTFNPKIGLTWKMVEALKLRGTWGTSFRAPPFYLSNLELRPPARQSLSLVNPTPTSPTNRTNTLVLTGVVRDLTEETAELWTAGFDFTPVDRLKFSGTYFNIRYAGRIGNPINSFSTVLTDPRPYAGTDLVILSPTQAQVDAICNSPDFTGTCTGTYGAIVDNRRQNIATTRMNGIDASVDYGIGTRRGDIHVGVDGTYLFKDEQAITPNSLIVDIVDTLRNPLALRLRGLFSWSLGGWTTNAAVNYAGSYNVANTPTVARIGSWTTVDLGAGYAFDRSASPLLGGTQVRLSVTNAFDTRPPFVDQLSGYDEPNASILGRTVSLQIVKAWE